MSAEATKPVNVFENGHLVRTYLCLHCGHEAQIEAVIVAPGVINWPGCYCASCPGHPRMCPS